MARSAPHHLTLAHDIRDRDWCDGRAGSPVAGLVEGPLVSIRRERGHDGPAIAALASPHAASRPSFQGADRDEAWLQFRLDLAATQFLAPADDRLDAGKLDGRTLSLEQSPEACLETAVTPERGSGARLRRVGGCTRREAQGACGGKPRD